MNLNSPTAIYCQNRLTFNPYLSWRKPW